MQEAQREGGDGIRLPGFLVPAPIYDSYSRISMRPSTTEREKESLRSSSRLGTAVQGSQVSGHWLETVKILNIGW